MYVIPLIPLVANKTVLLKGVTYEIVEAGEQRAKFLRDGREITTLFVATIEVLLQIGHLRCVSGETAAPSECNITVGPNGVRAYYKGKLIDERRG